MRTSIKIVVAVVVAALFGMTGSTFGAGGVPQGSIGLGDFNVALCYHNDTQWSLSKDNTGLQADSSITWIVTAAKGATTPNEFIVYGYLTVTNSSSAGTATLGNIVVNLQKRANNTWVSAAADISTKSQGDVSGSLGAFADIVAAGSQETVADNAAFGASNYLTGTNLPSCSASVSVGTFYTTAASIKLQFFNEDDNSEWAMTDTSLNTVPPLGIRHLLYKAFFDPVAAGIGAGDQVRVETLVTFGNAGARGGSGASLPNVDIDMDGAINGVASCSPIQAGPEDNVRTVPTRFSTTMPGLINCNSTVHLHDDGAYTDPDSDGDCVTATANNTALDENLTDTATRNPTVTGVQNICDHAVNFCNVATLQGVNCNWPSSVDCSLSLTINSSGVVKTVTEPCCVGVNLTTVPSCVTLPGRSFSPGDYCTFTQGGWGAKPAGNNVGALLVNNFSTVYPGGSVTVGSGFTMAFQNGMTVVTKKVKGKITSTTNTVLATGSIELYLPAGKTPDQLNTSLINPDKSHSGVFGGQVLALQLNVDFSTAGITQLGLGGLKYCAGDLPTLTGKTVSQILAEANAVLGGTAPGTGAASDLKQQDGTTPMTIAQVSDLITNLNEAFDGCSTVTDWANGHLCKP